MKTKFIIALILVFLSLSFVAAYSLSNFGNLFIKGNTNLNGSISGNIANFSIINEKCFVQAGNESDIQVKFNNCNGGMVEFPKGNYAISNTKNLSSNSTIIINAGANIYLANGANLTKLQDQGGNNYSAIFRGNGIENIKIFNYGRIEPNKYFGGYTAMPEGTILAVSINNASNVYIFGGYTNHLHVPYAVWNSQKVIVEDVISQGDRYNYSSTGTAASNYTNAAVWFECVNNGIINNIQGAGSEAVDLNADNQNIQINNVIWLGKTNDDEVIDINRGRFTMLNNIHGINASRLVNNANTAGERFAECSDLVATTTIGVNLYCDNCDNTIASTIPNSTFFNFDSEYNGINIIKGTFGSENLENGLVSYWGFDEYGRTSNNITLFDSSLNNYTILRGNGSFDNKFMPSWNIYGKTNSDLNFNGTTYLKRSIALSEISKNNSFSISIWFYPTVNTTYTLLANTHSTSDREGITVVNDTLRVGVFDGSSYISTRFSVVNYNQWNHLVWTFNNQTNVSRIFMDSIENFGTGSSPTLANNVAFTIGTGTNILHNTTGEIDEVKVYNRVLTPTEASALHNGFGKQADGHFVLK